MPTVSVGTKGEDALRPLHDRHTRNRTHRRSGATTVPTQSERELDEQERVTTMARSRYKILENTQPHFLTCTVVDWLPVFARPALAEIVLSSLQFLQDNNRIVLYSYVLMENHLHLIASSADLKKEIGDFKSYTARTIIDELDKERAVGLLRQLQLAKLPHKKDRFHQFWQEGSHPQLIQGDEMMRQKIEYIHNNPVRKGYVDDPVHWRYSSARNYAGLNGLINVTTEW